MVRPDLYVVARFLDALGAPDAHGKYTAARLQEATRLNYDIFRKYLARLEEKGLVVAHEASPKPFFVLTDKGWHARQEIVAWAKEFLEERL